MDKLVEVDAQYREWISEVSKRFHQSQIKAAVKVNDEMLRFYWQLGKELHDRKIEKISSLMDRAFTKQSVVICVENCRM